MAKQIPLTQGQVALVDDEDYEWLNQWKWRALGNSTKQYYAARAMTLPDAPFKPSGYRKQITIRMHHVLCPPVDGHYTDHKDGNTLNNQKANLRVCTPSQNTANRKVAKNNKLGVKGVRFDRGAYRADVRFENVSYYLGRFKTIQDAKDAYDRKAKELFGDFVRDGQ